MYSQSPASTRGVIAPDHVGRGPAAARLRHIDHVVVHQRRRVDHLDHRRQTAARSPLVGPNRRLQSSSSAGRSRLPPPACRYWLMVVMASTDATDSTLISLSTCCKVRLDEVEDFACRNGLPELAEHGHVNPQCNDLSVLETSRSKLRCGRRAANSSGTCRALPQSRCAVSTTNAGSLRLPRCGTGARYGAVGLDQQPIVRRNPRGLAEFRRFRKRQHAAEAQMEAEIQAFARLLRVAGEAVHHARHARGRPMRAQNASVSSQASRVWITIGLRRRRDLELPQKHRQLRFLRNVLVIIEADLADRHHLRMPQQARSDGRKSSRSAFAHRADERRRSRR